jgi:His/Glu/Gln/Arg/opine family amino acid ABC transporter permease subunit
MFDLDGYSGLILGGLKQTLSVGLVAMVLATIIGMLGAIAKTSDKPVLRAILTFYTATIRGIPELILLLLFFYGLPTMVQDFGKQLGFEFILDFNSFIAGTCTLAFIYGAFSTEVFRGAFNAIPRGQIEAADAMGMRPIDVFFRIKLPQAIRFAIPGMSNVWMLLIKATALISVIQLDEVMRMTKIAANATHKPFTAYLFAALVYLGITVVSMGVQKLLEKRYARGY